MALWQRRWTLFALSDRAAIAERSMTLALFMLLLALTLVTPISEATIDEALHGVTGQWNLADWLACSCSLGFGGALVLNTQSRLNMSVDELRTWFDCRVQRPITVVIPAMLALLVHSPTADNPTGGLFDYRCDIWLSVYWTLLTLSLGYLYILAIRTLLILRTEPRHRRIANIYMIAAATGVVGCTIRLASAWTHTDLTDCYWLGGGVMAIGFGYASTRSWRRKVRQLGARL